MWKVLRIGRKGGECGGMIKNIERKRGFWYNRNKKTRRGEEMEFKRCFGCMEE